MQLIPRRRMGAILTGISTRRAVAVDTTSGCSFWCRVPAGFLQVLPINCFIYSPQPGARYLQRHEARQVVRCVVVH